MSLLSLANEIEENELIKLLKSRFDNSKFLCNASDWAKVQVKLEESPEKIQSLFLMEKTGGEPHLFSFDPEKDEFHFIDCSKESPEGRRSLCYDAKALASRKKFKPKDSAMNLAHKMGVELLDEALYWKLQQNGNFDSKTSSWLKTPDPIRKLGAALFGDFRFETVFTYHNGAESYYAGRGFRCLMRL